MRYSRVVAWVSPTLVVATAPLVAGVLVLAGCGSGPGPGASGTGPGSSSPGSASATAGCPEGSTPDQPGDAAQARPNLSTTSILAAMDSKAASVVVGESEFVDGAGVATLRSTWTFDVCANAWADQGPDSAGSDAPVGLLEFVFDAAADRTVGLPTGLAPVWTYDLARRGWTEHASSGGGSQWWPLAAYDPDGAQVLAWEHHGVEGSVVKALDPTTLDWRLLHSQRRDSGEAPPATMGQVEVTFDTSVHRLILVLTNAGDRGETGQTWTFDPVEGVWDQGAPVPNLLAGGYPDGWAVAFDAAQGRTMLFADTAMLTYDAAEDTWTSAERGPRWPTTATVAGVEVDPTARIGHAMVYDPVNDRLVVLGGSVRPVGDPTGGTAPDRDLKAIDDVWAYDPASSTWTQLLAPTATPPSLGPG